MPDYEHPHRAEADIRSDVQVGRILYNTLRTAHRAGEHVAPAVAPSTREVAADLIAHTLATGNVPAITDATQTWSKRSSTRSVSAHTSPPNPLPLSLCARSHDPRIGTADAPPWGIPGTATAAPDR